MDIKKIQEKMKNVPFGNSVFQIQSFVANEYTPERNYRNVLLQISQKINAMEECRFRRKRKEIDIEEINEKLKNASGFDKRRLEVDLEEAEYSLENEIKLIEDCVIEIKAYENILDTLPDFTREQFEKSERFYWEKRLFKELQQGLNTTGQLDRGIVASLEKMGIITERNERGLVIFRGNIENKEELGMLEAPEAIPQH